MTHNHAVPGSQSRKRGKVENHFPGFCAGGNSAHISPPNAGYRGTAALSYRYTTICDHPGGLFAPACLFTHTGGGCHRASRKLGLLDSPLFPDCDPGTAGGCASYVGTTPLLFRDMLPRWVLWARLTARPGPLRSDMTFRQNVHYSNGFWRNRGNLVLLLMLRYDVTRGVTPRAQRVSTDHHVLC